MKAILGHINVDFDCLASMAAAKLLYPDFIIVIPDNKEYAVSEYLKDEVDFFDYIFASKLDEDITEIIMVDNSDLSRSGVEYKLLSDAKIVKIFDHHDYSSSAPQYGANISILVEMLIKKNISFSEKYAELFLLGLYEDTGFFSYVSTTSKDISVLSYLFPMVKNIAFISKYLSNDFSEEQLEFLDELVKNSEIGEYKKLKFVFTSGEREEYLDNLSFIAHRIMSILNADILFLVVRLERNVHVLARSSSGDVDIRPFIEQLGGGGHKTAGYASIKDATYIEVKERVKELIIEMFTEKNHVYEIMNSNVIFAYDSETVVSVNEKMVAHNHSKLPVVDNQGKSLGIITQKEIARLMHHNFLNYKISDFINYEVPVLYENDYVSNAENLLLVEGNSLVLVVDKEKKLKGIITKTDFLLTKKGGEVSKDNAKNFVSELRKKLSPTYLREIERIGEIADSFGYKAYIVGGFVRDLILKRDNFDIDIVVVGSGIKVGEAIASEQNLKVKIHKKFQTATILFDEKFKIDISTARSETYEKPGALPVVMRSHLKYDLFRRDFTINAMAISISKNNFGLLIDYFFGYKDLKKGLLKVLHNVSFIEDPTRILRGIRFAARFDFKFGKQTEKLLKNALSLGVMKNISGRRIKDEFLLFFKERYPEKILSMAYEYFVLQTLFPNIVYDKKSFELIREIRHTFIWFNKLYPNYDVEKFRLYFLALFRTMKREKILEISKKLELGKKFNVFVNEVFLFIRGNCKKKLSATGLRPSMAYLLFKNLSLETLLYLSAYYQKDEVFQRYISLYLIEIWQKKPLLSGNDVKKIVDFRGEKLGELLEKIHLLFLDGKLLTTEDAIRYIKTYYSD